jgi:hypothetical protein
MNRDYSSGKHDNITFFIGYEVEKTPAHDLLTLFVVGHHDADDIIDLARKNDCKHIYFGANQSFRTGGINDADTWQSWEDMILPCLDEFWCTLDMDVREVEGLCEGQLVDHNKFIPMISVKLPYIKLLGYNATIKIDDKDFNATNPGVWCHHLHSLLNRDNFTDWDQYRDDKVV